MPTKQEGVQKRLANLKRPLLTPTGSKVNLEENLWWILQTRGSLPPIKITAHPPRAPIFPSKFLREFQ